MTTRRKRIPTGRGAALMSVALFIGLGLLYASSTLLRTQFSQAIIFIVSILVLWYFSHAMSHLLAARICGVRTLYFYMGRSEIGNSVKRPVAAKRIANLLPTIGTKLEHSKLSTIRSPAARGFIFGSGAIVSAVIVGLVLFYAYASGLYAPPSLAIGTLFVVATIITEVSLGMRSGDFSKMKRELSRSR